MGLVFEEEGALFKLETTKALRTRQLKTIIVPATIIRVVLSSCHSYPLSVYMVVVNTF